MDRKKEKRKSLAAALFLALASIAAFQVNHVRADIPHDTTIQSWIPPSPGTHLFLNITITHDTGAPTSSHYVDVAQVNISGLVHDIPLSPQSTVTFVVQYDMGEVSGTPTVQARARCNTHGWSDWSTPQAVPEFPLITPFPLLAVATIAALFLRSKARSSSEEAT
jgi:hypothetical protein